MAVKNKVHKQAVLKTVVRVFPVAAPVAKKVKVDEAPAPKKMTEPWKAPKRDQEKSATSYLRRCSPPGSAIVVHRINGAYEVCLRGSPPTPRKSFAWTKRGMSSTVASVMLHLWILHSERTLEPPPLDLPVWERLAAGLE
jgi:hypothetical protein